MKRIALAAALTLLAVPCLAATHKRPAPEHPAAGAFVGLALLCQGGASTNAACTVVKIEPPDGVSLPVCTAAISAGARHLADTAAQHGQHVTISGVRCLTLDALRHLMGAPVASATPAPADPPAADAPPAPDDDTIHGSTDGWRHV